MSWLGALLVTAYVITVTAIAIDLYGHVRILRHRVRDLETRINARLIRLTDIQLQAVEANQRLCDHLDQMGAQPVRKEQVH